MDNGILLLGHDTIKDRSRNGVTNGIQPNESTSIDRGWGLKLSAGLLNYMTLLDRLGADFLGPKLQGNMKLQPLAYVAVFLGAGDMSLMAKWA